MTIKRINKDSRSVKQVKSNKNTLKFSEVTILVTLIGYSLLTSYTWPLGFIPIVSIEAFPILLVGFFLSFLFYSAYTLSLWYPIYIYLNQSERYEFIFDKNKQESKNKTLRINVKDLYLDCRTNTDKYMLTWNLLAEFIMIGLSVGVWYATFAFLPFTEALTMIAWTIFIYLSFFSFMLSVQTGSTKIFAYVMFVLTFLVFPLLVPNFNGDDVTANRLVKSGLEVVSLGGSIPVEITSVQQGARLSGELLFYDGSKAWIKTCNSENIIEVKVVQLTYLDKSLCVK